ncbi:MAG: hypothetical protein GF307_12260 [candidate division Zixibacteria bacterium]|nr:hypothetical protein [candidate division Zixibacteria bacterium]
MLSIMDKCNSVELLKSNGLRRTPGRRIVLDRFIKSDMPLSAQQLHRKVSRQSNIDLATVYRIIKILLDREIIREAGIQGNVQYYEMACEHNPAHPHFECTQCHKLYCLSPTRLENTKMYESAKSVGDITETIIEFRGICSQCLKKR